MFNFIWSIIKWSFRLAIVIVVIRVFFNDSPLYQNYLKDIFEPAFEALFNQLPPLEDHKQNTSQQNTQEETENKNQDIEENKQGNKQNINPKKTVKEGSIYLKNCKNLPSVKYDQNWNDLQNTRKYTANISVNSQTACKAYSFRENLNINYTGDDEKYYGELYAKLSNFSSPKMANIFKTFENIKKNKKLSQEQFAESIVTFIQNIPYTLVIDKSAKEAQKQGGIVGSYLRDKRPYMENIKFGLQTPIEFLFNKKGDCDTRTVLAYTILKRFGYDVAILNSKSHSMLGVNLPAYGTSVNVRGKKYFFWETTSENWQLGQMPDEQKHEKNWVVVLASKND